MAAVTHEDYLLGRSQGEFDRLRRQAELIEAETLVLLTSAGIGSGQRVLEMGSGAGDVAILAGRLVRPDGSVHGIERSEESAALANRRIAAAGRLAARVETGDLATCQPIGEYDALIGRFVLPYLQEPVATLARLAKCVRPGGVVALMEFDVRSIGSEPEIPLLSAMKRWIVGAYKAKGVPPGLGSSLGATFRAAGLPWPYLNAFQKVSCGPGGILWYFVELVRSLHGDIVAGGIATEAEIELASLQARLEEEAVALRSTVYSPRWVGGWARIPSKPSPA